MCFTAGVRRSPSSIVGLAAVCALLGGCALQPAASPSVPSPAPTPSSSPSTTAVVPALTPLPTMDGEIARTELFDGTVNSHTSALDLDGSDYFVVAECRSDDGRSLAYEVRIDDQPVTSAEISCDPDTTVQNSAFSGVTGEHVVDVEFVGDLAGVTQAYAILTNATG